MGISKPANGVIFAESSLEKAFLELAENSPLKKSIRKVIKQLTQNVFAGENIPKDRIPKDYIQKYKIDNLWWYPLANAWRLVYSIVTPSNVEILAVIIEYFDHKNYERRFGY
jgi:Txe/YoeB family toxin of Txe-Axe toxin-antitoxin module